MGEFLNPIPPPFLLYVFFLEVDIVPYESLASWILLELELLLYVLFLF